MNEKQQLYHEILQRKTSALNNYATMGACENTPQICQTIRV